MPLDPQLVQWLATIPNEPNEPNETVDEARAQWLRTSRRALELLNRELIPVDVVDREVDGLRLRVFRPPSPPVGVVVHFHGGGWVLGDLDTHHGHAGRLCVQTGAVVVSVDYRRAPEHRFPAAFEDAWTATSWAADEFGGRLAVAGDSAGGQLAASVALACRDAGLALAGQLLIYPVTDVRGGYLDNDRYPSRIPGERGVGLTLEEMVYFADAYVDSADRADWRVSPLAGDLRSVAPAVVHTAGWDVLHDEGFAYAQALQAAGVHVTVCDWPTLNHSYFNLGGVCAAADIAATQAARDLRALLTA